MAKRLTQDGFIEKLDKKTEKAYEVIGKYVNVKTKITVKHIKCGKIFDSLPSVLYKGACFHCARESKKLGVERFMSDVYNIVKEEYIVSGDYIDTQHKVEIKHMVCGKKYSVFPYNFLSGTRCPSCNVHPMRHNEEHIRNKINSLGDGKYVLLSDYINNREHIKIKHIECGHIYDVSYSHFANGKRCPKCAGNTKKTTEQFIKELKKIDDNYEILEGYIGTNTKLKVKHTVCGNVWKARPVSLLSGRGCPNCKNKSKGEKIIKEKLLNLKINFKPQYTENCGYKRLLRFDFSILSNDGYAKLLIEYDGLQHYEPVRFGGISTEKAKNNFDEQQIKDNIKNAYCKENNIPLLRIPYWDYENIEHILFDFLVEHGVLEEIKELENV